MKRIITYGTFDVMHYGHIYLLERLRALGNYLCVGVSSDEFNKTKGKNTILPYSERSRLVNSIKYVDHVFMEENWEQKEHDIIKYNIDIFGMGDDWIGKFDYLNGKVKVIYLPRTPNISSSIIKSGQN
jgi:glycerol-3-phosphate cytidylyltransferase